MNSGDSDRFEYIKQPHIIVLAVLAVLVIAGALFTANRRVAEINNQAETPTEIACMKFVGDARLCKFASVSESSASRSYRSVLTVVDDSGTTITTTDYENVDRSNWSIQQNGQEVDSFILLDADGYIRDPADGAWAHYKDPEFTPTDGDSTLDQYDFTSEDSEDVAEFRDRYKFVGEESCGDLTCFKYQVTLEGDEASTVYMWFDKDEYLLRRYQTQNTTTTTNTQYTYGNISIAAPSPVKTVSEDEFNKLLE